MEVQIRYCRNSWDLQLERISTLSSLKIEFKDHDSNSAKHQPEILGLPRVIANNPHLKKLDILIAALHNAPQSKMYLNNLLDERANNIALREDLTHLGLYGIVPALSQTTAQQLRFLKSIKVRSHDLSDSDHLEELWSFLLGEGVTLEEIVTNRMTVGLGGYLKESQGLRRLEILDAQYGSVGSNPTGHFYRDILPGLVPTLRRLVLRARWDDFWCIDQESIKHLSQCTELRYLAVTVDRTRYAKPDEPGNHMVR